MSASSQGERMYSDADGNPCTLDVLCECDSAWAANRIRATTAALADMFALIDEGFLCRSTKLDHEPDWAIKAARGMKRLADAYKQIPQSQQNGDTK